MDDKYLSMGRGDYLYHVVDGYAVSLSADNTVIVYNKTDMEAGVYTKDGPADEEITKLYESRLKRPTLFSPEITIEVLIGNIIDVVVNSRGRNTLKPIVELPKVTKVVMDGLDKSLETMAFLDETKDIQFICFGARKVIVELLGDNGRWISPAKFYNASSFKGEKIGRFTKYSLITASPNLEYIGVILSIDMKKRLEAMKDVQTNQNEESPV